MLHKCDDFAVDGWDVEDYLKFVFSGWMNDEVKVDFDWLWCSDWFVAEVFVWLF